MKDLIQNIAREVVAASVKLVRAKVTAVTEQYTCDVQPTNGDAKILDVKLRATENEVESGVVAFPKIGTIALILIVNQTDGYLLHATEIERVIVKQSGFRIEIDHEGNVKLNDCSNDGLVKLPVLQEEVAKLNAFLNAIKQTFQTWVPVPQDGGAALKAAMNAALASQQTADLSNAGNDKIKH